ncbi:MAG: hypothetical protein IPK21_23035 [Haliscomenobacter sp.]|nr:hypothetical protein [Haliscomenobacter sp.]
MRQSGARPLGQWTLRPREIQKLAQGDVVAPVAQDWVKVRAVLAAIGRQTVW